MHFVHESEQDKLPVIGVTFEAGQVKPAVEAV